MKLHHGHVKLAAIVLAGGLVLAGCGGGGAGGGGSTGGVTPTAPNTPQLANVIVRVILPPSAQGGSSSAAHPGGIRPAFVSPGTNGSSLVVDQHGTLTQVYTTVTDLSSSSPNCVGSAPRICTIPMQVPAGALDFYLKTYDAAPVSGAIPGTAHQLAQASVTQTITLGGNNVVNFALSGIIVGNPGVTCVGGCGALTYTSLPANGITQTFTFVVNATDASGNIITGSNPYATPLTVTLAESGGSGNASLIYNGTNVGTSATLVKPTDTLALSYNGGGAPGYSTQTNIGGTIIRISPMYAPGSFTTHKLTDSGSAAITEASAPGSVAYGYTNSCATYVTSASASGSGASGSVSFNTSAAPGTTTACNITVNDNLGSSLTYPLNFAVYGPFSGGGPGQITFPTGGSGSCATEIDFTAIGQTAVLNLTDGGFPGSFITGDTTPAIATVGLVGNTGTITAVAAGNDTITFSDGFGNVLSCPVTVTTTSGTVSITHKH